MKLSVDRILTTHVGSLPRPQDLLAMIIAKDAGEEPDAREFQSCVTRSVGAIVRQQTLFAANAQSWTCARHRASREPRASYPVTSGADVVLGGAQRFGGWRLAPRTPGRSAMRYR